MWKHLDELNKEFNEIKKSKKDSKKCLNIFFYSGFVKYS